MNYLYILIPIAFGAITSILHKRKGYSPFTGFLWGFLFSWIGLLVVAFEKDKATHDQAQANGEKSIGFWLAIFLGVGVVLIGLAIFFISRA